MRNLFLLCASYFFYGYWDWRFLILLAFMSLLNYSIAILIHVSKSLKNKKYYLMVGVASDIGVLSYFKYVNFFEASYSRLLAFAGIIVPTSFLNIILPLGISFYVFLSLSYIIDVYHDKIPACRNIIDVLLTLSFFPIISAGPIQRPISLLPQIGKERIFNYALATDGLKQILWGLFMKIVIADRCAVYANDIFHNFNNYSGSMLFLGGIFYAIQVYADFAGYSLMAVGVSKLFGFELMRNFAYPYFVRDIQEFWRRWHISLTSWYRDYVFLPLTYAAARRITPEKAIFLKADMLIYIIGISITWFLTGLWHGANYTFILWGLLNGLFLILFQILKRPRKRLLKSLKIKTDNPLVVIFERTFTLVLIVILWVVFRSESVGKVMGYLSGMFSKSFFTLPAFNDVWGILSTSILTIIFFVVEWIGREHDHPLAALGIHWPKFARYSMYYAIFLAAVVFGGNKQQFIYFQF